MKGLTFWEVLLARVTGLEPATSGVTGRRSNQLSYTRSGKGRGIRLRQRSRQGGQDAVTPRVNRVERTLAAQVGQTGGR